MSAPASLRVGVAGGTALPGNVRTFLSNLRRLLGEHRHRFECDLVVRANAVVEDQLSGYAVSDPGIEPTDRAFGTAITLARALRRYVRDARPDVLFQVTKFPLHGAAATVAGRATGTPVLCRLAGDNFNEHHFSRGTVPKARTAALNNGLGRIPLYGADRIIALGPHGRSELAQRGRQRAIAEIPQPVDRERFYSVSDTRANARREKLGMPPAEENRVVLTVGRLTRRKGMHDVLRTARTLSRRDASVEWWIVGEGPLRDALSAAPLVRTVGRVPHDELARYYHAADLLVHPSLIEGLPNVLLEARACGLPVVARDVGDCALCADRTYTDSARLPALVCGEYEPAELGPRFDDDTLREAYANALFDVIET